MRELFALLFVVGLIGVYFWQIVAIAALVGLIWGSVKLVQAQQASAAAAAARLATIAARADRQHAQVMGGDDRGVFGEYPPGDCLGAERAFGAVLPGAAPPGPPVKVVVNCPLCAAEQRIPAGAPRFRCGQCRETVPSSS